VTYPPQNPDDEPRSEPFRPVSYDLAPEFGTPAPASDTSQYSSVPQSGPPAPGHPVYPVSAQPGYPVSAQPAAYAQPVYQQPAYQQPAYHPVQPQQPAFAPPPPPKKGKGLKITLGVLGGVFAVCIIAACVWLAPFIKEISHVSAPPTLPGNLTKDTSQASKDLASTAESSLRSDVADLEEVATGVYTTADDPEKVVVVVAATGTFLSPGSEVDKAFTGFNNGSSKTTIGPAKKYDAGSLGGTVKCADGKATNDSSTEFAMCVWADRGSVGLVLFFGRTADESAPLFIPIREAVQIRT
jgi:hypothetical protein